jgi:hypothetical protein
LAAFSRAVAKTFANLALGFAQPHVENLRAVDEHEILFQVLTGALVVFACQVVGRRFADERFAAARRAIKQNALERLFAETLEQLGVEQGMLNRVADS